MSAGCNCIGYFFIHADRTGRRSGMLHISHKNNRSQGHKNFVMFHDFIIVFLKRDFIKNGRQIFFDRRLNIFQGRGRFEEHQLIHPSRDGFDPLQFFF
jgi:hypothetical protein